MEFIIGVAVGAAGFWAIQKWHADIWAWIKTKVFRQ